MDVRSMLRFQRINDRSEVRLRNIFSEIIILRKGTLPFLISNND